MLLRINLQGSSPKPLAFMVVNSVEFLLLLGYARLKANFMSNYKLKKAVFENLKTENGKKFMIQFYSKIWQVKLSLKILLLSKYV